MATLTLSIDSRTEETFRKSAELKFGKRKGSLGKAASEAFEEWAKREMLGSEAKMLEMLRTGFELGKIKWKSRDELHER